MVKNRWGIQLQHILSGIFQQKIETLVLTEPCAESSYGFQYLVSAPIGNTIFKILKTESWVQPGCTPTDGTMEGPNKTNETHTKRVLFQDVDLDHIALCDKQEVEIVQIVAAPQGKVQQLHTWGSKMIFAP